MLRAGYVCIATIHRTLTRTTGSLTCAKMIIDAIAHTGCSDTERESALKVDAGKKVPSRTWESNLRQRHDGPMLYQLRYISKLKTRPNLSISWIFQPETRAFSVKVPISVQAATICCIVKSFGLESEKLFTLIRYV